MSKVCRIEPIEYDHNSVGRVLFRTVLLGVTEESSLVVQQIETSSIVGNRLDVGRKTLVKSVEIREHDNPMSWRADYDGQLAIRGEPLQYSPAEASTMFMIMISSLDWTGIAKHISSLHQQQAELKAQKVSTDILSQRENNEFKAKARSLTLPEGSLWPLPRALEDDRLVAV